MKFDITVWVRIKIPFISISSSLCRNLSHRRHFEILVVFFVRSTVSWTVSNAKFQIEAQQKSSGFNDKANSHFDGNIAKLKLLSLSSHYDPKQTNFKQIGCEIYESLKICEIWQISGFWKGEKLKSNQWTFTPFYLTKKVLKSRSSRRKGNCKIVCRRQNVWVFVWDEQWQHFCLMKE